MSEMQDMSQALLDAMLVIANNGDQSLQFDKTIECEIEYAVDSATGEYRARYLNQAIPVYDLSLEMTYKEKDIVFVSVPMSDFSNKKIIVGKKSKNASELKNIILDRERVNLVGLPIHEIYPSLAEITEEHGIYGSTASDGFAKSWIASETTSKDNEFQGYAKGKKALMISADFKTDWYYQYVSSGNYGISITFKTKDDEDLAYVLDTHKMFGDPLKYNDQYYHVETLLSIDGDNLKEVVGIEFFSQNFVRPDGKTEEELRIRYDTGDAEIFVKNIFIQFAEAVDLTGYTVFISPVYGIYFNDNEELLLKAIMKYNGNTDVVNTSKIKFHWFERDTTVSILSENYSSIGGVGWRDLSQTGETLIIKREDFVDIGVYQQKYKVVAFYEDYKASNIIDLYLSDNRFLDYKIILKPSADGRKATLLISPDPGENYYAAWIKEDENGVIFNLEETSFTLKNIDIANINGIHKYYCGIVGRDYNRVITTLEIEVSRNVPEQDFSLSFNIDDNGLYYYDESGIMVNENITKSIDFSFYPDDIEYEYTWEFLNYQNGTFMYIPVSQGNELIGNHTKDDKSIDFQIRRKFERKAAEDNIIKLTIQVGGKDYVFLKQLEFVKEGDPGTNGSSLVMRVNYLNNRAILSDVDTTLNLDIQLYFNGSPTYNGVNVNTLFNFSISVPKDYKLNNPLKDLELTFAQEDESKWTLQIPAFTINQDLSNSILYIKAKSNNRAVFPYDIGYLMPIAQTTESIYQTYEFVGPTIIMYDEQGYSPKWDNSSLALLDKEGKTIDTEFKSLGNLTIDEGEIKPLEYFDPINLYYAVIANDCYIQPIVGELNAFSKSILNAWDGATIQIDEEGSYILAAQMGAGYKESNNSFTGVLMGILETSKDTLYPGTGLLGFNQGEGAFGFYTDGHAFIGQSGKGRIEFDATGNNAIIQSGNYEKNASGMKIDLSNGYINAHDFALESSFITINSEHTKFILEGPNKTLLNVSDGSYYLQSNNFVENISDTYSISGTKINLQTGEIKAKNFAISSSGTANFSGNITGSAITGSSFGIEGGDFYVSSSGRMTAKSANITGNITATTLSCYDGTIGGWLINDTGLYKDNVYLKSDGSMFMGDSTLGLRVDNNGVQCYRYEISYGGGSSTIGYIGIERNASSINSLFVVAEYSSLVLSSKTTMKLESGSTFTIYAEGTGDPFISYENGTLYFDDENGAQVPLRDLGGSGVAVFG